MPWMVVPYHTWQHCPAMIAVSIFVEICQLYRNSFCRYNGCLYRHFICCTRSRKDAFLFFLLEVAWSDHPQKVLEGVFRRHKVNQLAEKATIDLHRFAILSKECQNRKQIFLYGSREELSFFPKGHIDIKPTQFAYNSKVFRVVQTPCQPTCSFKLNSAPLPCPPPTVITVEKSGKNENCL